MCVAQSDDSGFLDSVDLGLDGVDDAVDDGATDGADGDAETDGEGESDVSHDEARPLPTKIPRVKKRDRKKRFLSGKSNIMVAVRVRPLHPTKEVSEAELTQKHSVLFCVFIFLIVFVCLFKKSFR